jgi:iron complex transport system substrate-binding protein
VAVHLFNQRDVAGCLAMIRTLGALVGVPERADILAAGLEARLTEAADAARDRLPVRVYFEEWDTPMISGIGWVSDLIGLAGGRDVFPDLSRQAAARDRIVTSEQVIAAAPEVILASWCGKRVNIARIRSRPGWAARSSCRRRLRRGRARKPVPRCATASCARSRRR